MVRPFPLPAKMAHMPKKNLPWLNRGGIGPWVISQLRSQGVTPVQIWSAGHYSRQAFRLLARIWGTLPVSLRKRCPVQLVELMSVRLHHWNLAWKAPKGLSGVLARSSDFVVLDGAVKNFLAASRRTGYVGVMLKPGTRVLPDELLEAIGGRAAVSGGHDGTFPEQWDARYEKRTSDEVSSITQAIGESGCRRWYAENLTSRDSIYSPIPGGVLPSPWRGSVSLVRTRPRSSPGSTIALCAHRDTGSQRAGPQFDERRMVTALSLGTWKDFVKTPRESVSLSSYRKLLREHPFTLCVEGGGIDPSPKAFEALRQGSIPIIKNSPLADAYRRFPVLVVEDWLEESLSYDFLLTENDRIRGLWPDWFLVTERMKLSYWVELISRCEDTRMDPVGR